MEPEVKKLSELDYEALFISDEFAKKLELKVKTYAVSFKAGNFKRTAFIALYDLGLLTVENIRNEFTLLSEKKSKLSASQREVIDALTMSTIEELIAEIKTAMEKAIKKAQAAERKAQKAQKATPKIVKLKSNRDESNAKHDKK